MQWRSLWRLTVMGPALGCALAASADSVEGTRSEEVRETGHEALLTLGPSHATLRVRRTLHNGGPRHDQAVLLIDVPAGGVATGLRTLGENGGKPVWFDGELMEAEAAAARYRELTGMGAYYPKDPALLSWRDASQLALQVFPIAPGGDKTVEYTYALPVHYSGGRYRVSLPRMGTDDLAASLRVQADRAADRVVSHGRTIARGAELVADGEELGFEVGLELANPDRLRVRLAVSETGERSGPGDGDDDAGETLTAGAVAIGTRSVVQLGAQVAPRLSELPQGAYIVVLIDVSRSQSTGELAVAVAATRAYLDHFTPAALNGHVQILLFDRSVRALHPQFVDVATARAALAALPMDQRNGTDLGAALAEAARWFAHVPARAPRRMLLLSDLLTASSIDPDGAARMVAETRALLHAASPLLGDPLIERRDDDRWASAARDSGGVLWNVYGYPEAADAPAPQLYAALEHWARPTRIDNVRVEAQGSPPWLGLAPDQLAEGEELQLQGIAISPVQSATITGAVWAEPVRVTVTPDAEEGRLLSALVFGSELLDALSEREMMTLALRGGAVSPVTSYLAIEPGVRPSTEGLEEGSGYGSGAGGFTAHDVFSPRVSPQREEDPYAFLNRELGVRWKMCGGGARYLSITVETTLRELAAIGTVETADPPTPDALECMRAATWQIELPESFRRPHATWTVVM